MLNAEELHDAIALATSRPGSFKAGEETVGMAMQLSGPSGSGDVKYFMQTFGQSNRNNPPRPLAGFAAAADAADAVAGGERSGAGGQRTAAWSVCSTPTKTTMRARRGRVVPGHALAACLAGDEKQVALAALAKDRVAGAQDLQWALINQVEFFFNY